jgi:hypothetical protein
MSEVAIENGREEVRPDLAACMPFSREGASSMQGFTTIVEPLERRAGVRLNGPGLAVCFRAFIDAPDRFPALARDALARGRNPVALLVRMVKDGDHRLPALPQQPEQQHRAPAGRPVDTCVSCGQKRPLDPCSLRCEDCET